MKLTVIDKTHYKKLKGKRLSTVYRHTKSEWRCTTPRGSYVYIKYKSGLLAISVAQREYDIANKIMLVGSTVDLDNLKEEDLDDNNTFTFSRINYPPLEFKDIMKFLEWKCDEEQIWDGYC